MTLLKNDGSLSSPKTQKPDWPEEIKLNIKNGWNFGIGFGLAMTVAVPFILLLGGLILMIILSILALLGSY